MRAAPAGKRRLTMATPKKKKTIVSASDGAETTRRVKEAAPVGNATGLRIGAVALWLVAIALEVLAVLIFNGTVNWTFLPSLTQIIIALVLDLIFVIIGSLLWKKANHIKPASKRNKLRFWLWNNMGLIVCALAFVPFVILALTNKKADKKTKTVASVVAVIALLIGGLLSYEWNPISQEEQQAAISAITEDVYWSPFGHKYHTSQDCSSLNQSDTLTVGTVEEAIAAGRTDLCKFCAKRDNIEGVRTDDAEISDGDTAAE